MLLISLEPLQRDCRSSLGAWSARHEEGLRQLRWCWLEILVLLERELTCGVTTPSELSSPLF